MNELINKLKAKFGNDAVVDELRTKNAIVIADDNYQLNVTVSVVPGAANPERMYVCVSNTFYNALVRFPASFDDNDVVNAVAMTRNVIRVAYHKS